jgi:hypothetical protein
MLLWPSYCLEKMGRGGSVKGVEILGGDEGVTAVISPAQEAHTGVGCEAGEVTIGLEVCLRCCGCPDIAKVFAGVLEWFEDNLC